MEKTIICLANSRKNRERCVAGKVLTDSSIWIRPVSNSSSGAITKDDQEYENGRIPKLLDIINSKFAYQKF